MEKRKRGRPKNEAVSRIKYNPIPPQRYTQPPPKSQKTQDEQETIPYIGKGAELDLIQTQINVVRDAINSREADLPHLYGWGWYKWAREFFESRNKLNFLVAGNQLSKSSSAIRKNIEWACNKDLWPGLWPGQPPKQFYYFYPTAEIATAEFLKKWVTDFLPRNTMMDHEWYGWKAQMGGGDITAIHFNSGVSIYFKAYAQKIENLQSATISMITADEEIPASYADELMARLFATDGYWNMVFTATIGQEIWYRTMERIGQSDEAYPAAAKWVVSMYDCLTYEDGTPSPWTIERIKDKEAMCSSENERLRRVMGRFVRDAGSRYGSFNPTNNVNGTGDIPNGWKLYSVVDVGSGRTAKRKMTSCGAVLFLAVNPEFSRGSVIKTWRGDGIDTTSGDILDKYVEMASRLPKTVSNVYDFGSKEFGLLAQRRGIPFHHCNKDKVGGEGMVNLLFKLRALEIPPGVSDNQKLVTELMLVPLQKTHTIIDDLSDCLKYVCMSVPWNHQALLKNAPKDLDISVFSTQYEPKKVTIPDAPDPSWTQKEYSAWEVDYRRGLATKGGQSDWGIEEEIAEWNDAYGL